LRLAIVHHDLFVRGGAERLACEVGDRLEKRGHEVVYVTSRFIPELSYPKLRSKKVIKVGFPVRLPGGYAHAYVEAFNTFRSLLKTFRRVDVDALLFSKQYSLLYFAKRLRNVPSVMYVHWPERLSAQVTTTLRRFYRRLIEQMEGVSFLDADAVLCNSKFTARVISALFSREAIVAYPGVDTDFFKPSDQENSMDENLILSVNRFAEYKNLELAIEAMCLVSKEIPEAHLIIAGNVDKESYGYYSRLRKMVDDKGLSRAVTIIINITDADILKLYQRCAIFLYTPTREHFGIGPIEAMACGKPVIVSDHGGPKESVIHEVTGFRLPNNPKTWADHIVKLVNEPEIRIEMGKAGRRHTESNFTWDRTVDMIESVLKDILGT